MRAPSLCRRLRLAAALNALLAMTQVHGQPAAGPPAETWILIHAGKLLAEAGREPLTDATLVVHNDRIDRIAAGLIGAGAAGVPAGAAVEVIELRNRFVLPGLMDSHVHLNRATGAYAPSPFALARRATTSGDATVNALINAQLTLAAGFTTVRDVGSDEQSVFAVRDAIRAGKLLGPTILAAGPIVHVTGGHGKDPASPEPGASPDERASTGTCDGADECRREVRYLHKHGSDLIKYTSTGGFSDKTGTGQQMFSDEMRAIIDSAHQLGLKVATHGYDAAALKDAIRAGVDSIEHGWLLDDEGIRMMKTAGTTLVPTLTIARPPAVAMRFMKPGEEPESVTLRNRYAVFEKAYKAGVRIAMGTDCGIYPHGRNADELAMMVKLGMKPADAIRAATVNTAALFGLTDAGSLEAGKRADLIAVSGDPLQDITALQAVDFVMKAGRVARRNGAMTSPVRLDLGNDY